MYFDQLDHATRTDVGVRRSHNQDSHTVLLATDEDSWLDKGHVFVVADGMGAHAVGEMASAMACNIIPHTFHKYAAEGVVPALRKAFQEANSSIHERGQQNREFQGMGTTSTALVLRPEGAWIGHVGDSRAYRIRNGKVEQLSFDHSLLWEKARRQNVRPEDLKDVPHNIIVRSMGPDANVEPDVQGPHPVEEGDTFLLCSDGLCGQVPEDEMGAVVSVLPPADACHLLVDLANLKGGPDNITVIIARIATPKGKRRRYEPAPMAVPRNRKPLYQYIPWPFYFLLAGMALAGGAAALIYYKLPGGEMSFILAALAIIAGCVSLWVYNKQEKERREQEPEEEEEYQPQIDVFREVAFAIDDARLTKLQKTAAALVRESKERQWELDWNAHQRFQQRMEQAVAKQDLTTAFRECCRSLRPLLDAVERYRHKEEAFQPNWDKKARGSNSK